MKYSFLLTGLIFIAITSCTPKKNYNSFGAKIEADNAMEFKAVSSEADKESNSVKLTAIVDEVCQNKGCWMILKNEGGLPIRVTFKDYGFFVPMDIAGKEVIVQGELKKNELDPLMAQHYAEDAGEIYDDTKSYLEYSLIAEGVLVEADPE